MVLLAAAGCTRLAPQNEGIAGHAPPLLMASARLAPPPTRVRPRVIVFVWDGLRPDSVTARDTPNLARLRDRDGANFANHHSVYPTFTMMNAAALATGAYPHAHGFYGNTEYQPGASGQNAEGKALDFDQPIFTEDHGVLQALDRFQRARGGRGLFEVGTLFEAAHRAGLHTAAVGKIGPVFLQDVRPDPTLSYLLDENIAAPLSFARSLQGAGFSLPANVVRFQNEDGQVAAVSADNGNPTATRAERQVRLDDGVTADPRAALGSAHNAANGYLMSAFLEYVLPKLSPDLSLLWLRNPDSTQHQFGPGSSNALDALHDQDALLGKLAQRLDELGLRDSTDLIVVSDHGHSTVAGDPALFPLRALTGEPNGQGRVGALDPQGFPVSGDLRSAHLLAGLGFQHVYDGGGCSFDPVLSGMRADGSLVYPTQDDRQNRCEGGPRVSPTAKTQAPSVRYTTPSYRVPVPPPKDAIVIAANGGSEYYYLLDHSPTRLRALVSALQEQRAYGVLFVANRYGAIPGAFPFSAIYAEGEPSASAMPDLIVSFAWDEQAIAGSNGAVPGTEYASAQRYRGSHGAFSPRDVHNTLIASGPHFKAGFLDPLPTSNVDLAPTIASWFQLDFAAPDGRVLSEAASGDTSGYQVERVEQHSEPVTLRKRCEPNDPACKSPSAATVYAASLHQQVLTTPRGNRRYTYLDRASVTH